MLSKMIEHIVEILEYEKNNFYNKQLLFYEACEKGNIEYVKNNFNDVYQNYIKTGILLKLAIYHKHQDIVDYLLPFVIKQRKEISDYKESKINLFEMILLLFIRNKSIEMIDKIYKQFDLELFIDICHKYDEDIYNHYVNKLKESFNKQIEKCFGRTSNYFMNDKKFMKKFEKRYIVVAKYGCIDLLKRCHNDVKISNYTKKQAYLKAGLNKQLEVIKYFYEIWL